MLNLIFSKFAFSMILLKKGKNLLKNMMKKQFKQFKIFRKTKNNLTLKLLFYQEMFINFNLILKEQLNSIIII